MSEPPIPKKRKATPSLALPPAQDPTQKSPAQDPTQKPGPATPRPTPALASSPLNPRNFPPVPPSELTPAELMDGLTRVVEQLKELIENPSKKPLTGEVGKKMEEVRVLTTFLSAVYANMIRIAVEEKGETPNFSTEDQRSLAMRTEALKWTIKALQEKAALQMRPPVKKVPLSAQKRKSRMQRTQGDGEWKRM